MKLILTALGSRGDVQPTIALAQRLGRRGHRVELLLPSDFEGWVRGLGFPFLQLEDWQDLPKGAAGEVVGHQTTPWIAASGNLPCHTTGRDDHPCTARSGTGTGMNVPFEAERAVGHEHMQVGMPVDERAEALHGDDRGDITLA